MTRDAEYLTFFFKNCCSLENLDKKFMEAVGEENFQTVLLFIYTVKNTFIHVSWINPFFKLQIHCVLNGMIKMDKLIALLVSQQVLLPLKSVIFVSRLFLFSLHSHLSCPQSEATLYFGQHYHTHDWVNNLWLLKNRDCPLLGLIVYHNHLSSEKANLLFL